MKKIFSKLNDIGSFDLKNTIRVLFWIGVIMIIFTTLRYRYLLGFDVFYYSMELIPKPNSIEMIRSNVPMVDYIKLTKMIIGVIINLVTKIIVLRIGCEFSYIILNGFKSLGNSQTKAE